MVRRAGLAFLLLGMILFSTQAPCQDGETLFMTKCGSCHKAGGEVKTFAPVKYASSQWKRFFKRNKHKRKKDIGDLFTAGELELIKEYLMDHAADSDRPIAAGLK